MVRQMEVFFRQSVFPSPPTAELCNTVFFFFFFNKELAQDLDISSNLNVTRSVLLLLCHKVFLAQRNNPVTFTLLYSTTAVGKQTNTNVNIECDTGKKKYAFKFEKCTNFFLKIG